MEKPKVTIVCNLAPACDDTKDCLKCRYPANTKLLTLADLNRIITQEGDNA